MTAKKITVMFSSAGRRVALQHCFRNAAESLGVSVRILAADLAPDWSPACHCADEFYSVPHCLDERFIPTLLDLCDKTHVSLLVPTIDTELMVYARALPQFEKIGCRIVIPPEWFVQTCRNKMLTSQWLAKHGIDVPKTMNYSEAIKAPPEEFPLLAKPAGGSCSAGICEISSREYLVQFGDQDDYIFQELCTGMEYTVNCYYVAGKGLISAIPHYRKFVRAGEVCFAQTVDIPAIAEVARIIGEHAPDLSGILCFQSMANKEGQVRTFEINARFGGGYPIADRAGGTFAKWLLQEALGQEPDYTSQYQVGLKMLRYDDAIFL